MKYKILLICLCLNFISCKQSDHNTGDLTVYVGGYLNPMNEYSDAVLWTNGKPEILIGGQQNQITSIFMNGGDLYMSGFRSTGYADDRFLFVADFWKNGTRDTVPAKEMCKPTSIFVDAGDIYITTIEYPYSGMVNSKLWKNKISIPIVHPKDKYVLASKVVVSANDVFVIGLTLWSQQEEARSRIWKNGISIPFTDMDNSTLNDIAVVGSDVYLTGWEKSGPNAKAKYWKNGIVYYLSKGDNYAEGKDMYINGQDVYVVGFENNTAMIWKNSIGTPLTNGKYPAQALSMTMFGKDVYVCGFENNGIVNIAKYWKNGVPVVLGTESSVANEICVGVKPR